MSVRPGDGLRLNEPYVNPPLISVIIPTHNRAGLLVGAIESVLRQCGGGVDEPGSLEVIVVDDASTDHTPDVVARYDHAVVGLRNERNCERGAARNLGAAEARGAWLAFLDSDDEWEDQKLTAQLDSIGAARSCVTGCWLIDDAGGLLGMDDRGADRARDQIDLINPYRAVPSSLLIDRDLFGRLGGFPEDRAVQGSEDWLFMAKLLSAGHEPVVLRHPWVRYRVHAGNSTANPEGYLDSGLAAVDWLERNHLTTAARARAARAQKYEVAARAHALAGEFGTALSLMARAASLSRSPAGVVQRTVHRSLRAAAHKSSRGWLDTSRSV